MLKRHLNNIGVRGTNIGSQFDESVRVKVRYFDSEALRKEVSEGDE